MRATGSALHGVGAYKWCKYAYGTTETDADSLYWKTVGTNSTYVANEPGTYQVTVFDNYNNGISRKVIVMAQIRQQ